MSQSSDMTAITAQADDFPVISLPVFQAPVGVPKKLPSKQDLAESRYYVLRI